MDEIRCPWCVENDMILDSAEKTDHGNYIYYYQCRQCGETFKVTISLKPQTMKGDKQQWD